MKLGDFVQYRRSDKDPFRLAVVTEVHKAREVKQLDANDGDVEAARQHGYRPGGIELAFFSRDGVVRIEHVEEGDENCQPLKQDDSAAGSSAIATLTEQVGAQFHKQADQINDLQKQLANVPAQVGAAVAAAAPSKTELQQLGAQLDARIAKLEQPKP